MRFLAIYLALISIPAVAEPHMMSVAFAERPCAETLDYIENPGVEPEGTGFMAMAFGYLLGFQAANGGDLSGESETILRRITADCAERPGNTALELLESYAP